MDIPCATLAFIDGVGSPEMLVIFVLVLLLFGGKKLPEFARGFGKTMREFKKAASGVEEEFKRALEEDERKQQAEEERKRQAALPAGETTTPTTTDTSSATGSPNDPAGPHIDPYNTPEDYPYYDSTPSPTGTDSVDPAQKKTTEGATQPGATGAETGATAAAPESDGTTTEVATAGPDANGASAPAPPPSPVPAQPASEPEKKP